jgi:DNA polymerase-1
MNPTFTSSRIYFIDTLDSALLDAFHNQSAGVPAVTFDLETTGLSPIDHQISLIGIGVPAKSGFQSWIFDIQAETKLAAKLKDFWQQEQLKIAHNVKFDASFLKHHTGAQAYPIFDTMIASQIIHNGRGPNYRHALET